MTEGHQPNEQPAAKGMSTGGKVATYIFGLLVWFFVAGVVTWWPHISEGLHHAEIGWWAIKAWVGIPLTLFVVTAEPSKVTWSLFGLNVLVWMTLIVVFYSLM